MDIKQLESIGAFVSQRPVKRTFEANRPITKDPSDWDDPEVPEFTGETEPVSLDVYIKRLSSADEIAIAQASQEDRTFVMIYCLVYGADGNRLFESIEQAKSLASWLLVPLIDAIEGVASRSPKKHLTSATHSGSRSRSHLAEGRQKNGKRQ